LAVFLDFIIPTLNHFQKEFGNKADKKKYGYILDDLLKKYEVEECNRVCVRA